MNFDSNRAWQEATAAVSASRSLLLPVAGVFLLIPNVATSFFLGDVQTRIVQNMQNPSVLAAIFDAEFGRILGITLLAMLAMLVGNAAVLVLLTDRRRPTVGEAILRAARFLPTMVGIVILTYLALFLLVMVLAIIGAVLGAIIGTAGGVLLVLGLLAVICVVVTKLSLTLPAMVMENQLNPVAAITRSWRLTSGNTLRLLGFYALLFIAYMIVAVIIMVVIGAITALFSGGGTAGQGTLIVTGLVSGAISAAVAVLFNGVLAANYRQLSGNSGDQIEETFR